MDELEPSWRDPLEELPHALFGYRIRNINQYVNHMKRSEESRARAWSDETQRLTIEITRLNERRKTLLDIATHVQMECERLKLQLERDRINTRFAEDGAHQEILRLHKVHQQQVALADSTHTQIEREVHHSEQVIWQLAENLTRVLQETQTVANQQLSTATVESIWKDWATTVLGSSSGPWNQEVLVSGAIIRHRIPQGMVQTTSRQGLELGYLTDVLLSSSPPAIVGYGLNARDIILPDDVQVLRLKHITVREHHRTMTKDKFMSLYQNLDRNISKPSTGPALHDEKPKTDRETIVGSDTKHAWASSLVPEKPATQQPELNQPENRSIRSSNPAVEISHMPQFVEKRDDDVIENAATIQTTDRPASPISDIPSVKPEYDAHTVQDEPDAVHDLIKPFNIPVLNDELFHNEVASSSDPVAEPPHSILAVDPPIMEEREDTTTFQPDREDPHDLTGESLPDPSWHEDVLQGPPINTDLLRLPGVDEALPPSLSVIRSDAIPMVFDDEPLPGMSVMKDASVPPPTWTDQGESPRRAMAPPPQSTPSPESNPEFNDSGGLDVRSFLYGKRVGQDIQSAQGTVLAHAGDLITPDLVQRVEQGGFLPDLIVHMVF